MARNKVRLSSRATASHLNAIGRVAAESSILETAMLKAISILSGLKLQDVAILAGPAGFFRWVDMLIVICRKSEAHKLKEKELEAVCGLLQKLQGLRNHIVHAVWLPQERGTGLIGQVMNPGLTSGKDKAKGFGIPKRGRNTMVFVHWTAPQMRLVASLTARARTVLLDICDRKKPASPREQSALARKGQTNLRRIRSMLDALPDPFHA